MSVIDSTAALRMELICAASGLQANMQNPTFAPGPEAFAKWRVLLEAAAYNLERMQNQINAVKAAVNT